MKPRLLTVALLAASCAYAGDLSISGAEHETYNYGTPYYDYNGTPVVPGQYPNPYMVSGFLTTYTDASLPLESFVAYCVELHQKTAGHNNPQPYARIDPVPGAELTALQFSRLTNLFGYAGGAVTATADQSAAIQLAAWEITLETSSNFGYVGDTADRGTFWVAGAGTSAIAIAQAESWLSMIDTPTSMSVSMTLYTSPTYQDVITATAVPEPAAPALLVAGLIASGLLLRRRQQDADRMGGPATT